MTPGRDDTKRMLFAPAGEAGAAEFLTACSRLAGEGRRITVSQTGSPFAFPPELDGLARIEDVSELERLDRPSEIVLSHEHLSGVLELSRTDLLVRAGGGTPLAMIEEAVRAEGLYFPHFDASCRDDLTLAALLMEGPVPVLAAAYGGIRESVLSVRLVTGEGEAIHSGSRAVKDVAGYEIIGLLIGAGGRYGMIAEATLRLLPGPRTIVRAAVSSPGPRLARIARELRRRRPSSAAVLAGRESARIVAEGLEGPAPDEDDDLLWIEAHVPVEEAEEAVLGEIEELAGDGARIFRSVPAFPELRRRCIRHACEAGDDPQRVMHISWDDDDPTAFPEPLGWRDLFPPRAHVLVPMGPTGGGVPGAAGSLPALHRVGSERRLRADLLELRSGKIRGSRMTGDWSLPEGKGAEHAADAALRDIEERIKRVFDPAGVLRR
jgi:hypothetical protein